MKNAIRLRRACLALLLLSIGFGTASAQRPAGRLLVVPFDVGRDPRTSWLGEAVALLAADDLIAAGADAITRDERLRAFDRLQVPPQATLTRGTIIKIGQLVGASTVVSGRVELQGDQLVLHVQATRIDTGRVSLDFDERGPLDTLLAVVDRASRRLVPASSVRGQAELQQTPLAAFEHYVRGVLSESTQAKAAFLEKALVLDPRFDRARLALSRARAELGEWPGAFDAAAAVPEGSPFRRRAQFEASVAELHLRKYDEAFERLQALAREAPAPEVFNNLGVIQLRRGATAQTGRPTYFFNKAVEADPAVADYAFNLGYAYWRDQDYPAALYWLREAVRRDPADSDAHFVLGAALQVTGAGVEAQRERELARRLSAEYEEQGASPAPDTVKPDLERLRQYLEPPGARRAESALAATEQREQRGLVSFHLERGRHFFERENDREALAELQRAIYLSPYQAEAHTLMGQIYLRSGRAREAIEAFKIALWSEESAAGHVALGEAYLQAHNADAARREAQRALEMAPGLADAAALLERAVPAR